MSRGEQDILSFVRDGLIERRGDPGWIHIADATGINYTTLWRIVHEDRDLKLSTLVPISDWLKTDEKKRARA